MRGATPCIKVYPSPKVRLTRYLGGLRSSIIRQHQKEPGPENQNWISRVFEESFERSDHAQLWATAVNHRRSAADKLGERPANAAGTGTLHCVKLHMTGAG